MGYPKRLPTVVAIFLLSAATLAWEIMLTRLFAITQFYHFAFLAVNVALLGFGASGAVLYLRPRWGAVEAEANGEGRAINRRLGWTAVAFVITLLAGYGFVNALPFDSYAIAWDRRQVWLLIAYYLALGMPFFSTGLAVGMALATRPEHSHDAYAANLLGSAAGALLAPFLLTWFGVAGGVFFIALLGLGAALVAQAGRRARRWLVYLPLVALLAFAAFAPPRQAQLQLSPYKGLPQALNYPRSQIIAQTDSSFSRLDLIESAGIRSLPGLSFQYRGPLPPQYGLLSDGDDLSPVLDTRQAIDWRFLDYLPEALAYRLAAAGPALVLHPRGGLAIWQAVAGGASPRQVVAIESDPGVAAVIDRLLDRRSPYRSPQVEKVSETGRSFLQRDWRFYDVIHLALAQPYRPVTMGALSLSENYDLTVEAVQAYLAHLTPDGILVLSRWLQTPPSESVRTLALLIEGLQAHGIDPPAQHIVAIRGTQVVTFFVKQSPWTAQQLQQVRDFARARRFDLAFAPDLRPEEINQFSVLPEPYYENAYRALLTTGDRRAFYDGQPFDVAPPRDDHPFFFHFFRWSQTPTVLRTLGQTWQPFGGSGALILVALLGLAILASALLILGPLALRQWLGPETAPADRVTAGRWQVLVYFAALGFGFLLVEIPLIQRFILFLGHPTLALAVVLAGLLFWSGLGSLAAPRVAWRGALLALLLVLAAYQVWLVQIFDLLLGAPQPARLLAAVLLLAPLGLLMGMPFPRGVRWLASVQSALIAWAWAINGCASVIASVLAALLALQWGFNAVMWLGWVCYALALAMIWPQAVANATRPPVPRPPTAQNAPRLN